MQSVVFVLEPGRMLGMFDSSVEHLRAEGVDVSVFPALAAVPDDVRGRADILAVPGFQKLAPADLADWSNLRAVVSPFTGVEGFDIPAFSAANILIANGQAVENSTSTAEATVMMLLSGWYDYPGAIAQITQNKQRAGGVARMLAGRTVGVVGYGAVAQRVVSRLVPFEVELLVHSRSRRGELPASARWADLEELLQQSDIVCLCLSLNADNHQILNAERLAMMKPEALLVNSARGGLVDEAALARQLAERPDMRAALDVFAIEPLPSDSPLRDLPNVILTPHNVCHTREAVGALPDLLNRNIKAVLAGQLPSCHCNPEISEAWQARYGKS